jgi:hypothetical protein
MVKKKVDVLCSCEVGFGKARGSVVVVAQCFGGADMRVV